MLAFWRWERLRVTAMLPTLLSKQWKYFGVNTKVSIFLITSILFAINECCFMYFDIVLSVIKILFRQTF